MLYLPIEGNFLKFVNCSKYASTNDPNQVVNQAELPFEVRVFTDYWEPCNKATSNK
jgi:hypothetical protein